MPSNLNRISGGGLPTGVRGVQHNLPRRVRPGAAHRLPVLGLLQVAELAGRAQAQGRPLLHELAGAMVAHVTL